MMMRYLTRAGYAVVIAMTLALSACNKSPEPLADPITENLVTEIPIEEPVINGIEIPASENAVANIANMVAPPEFSDTEQMRDDADATGLTARLPSEDAPGQPTNETQPAQ